MKKLFALKTALLLVTAFIPLSRSHSQAPDVVAAISGLIMPSMEQSKLANTLYYAQSIEQMISNATSTYNQLQNMLRQWEMSINNLKGIGNVKDLDTFMNWYNRQLYLERKNDAAYNALNIKIGDKKYTMKEIDDIPGALKNGFLDAEYWERSLTDKERREMWTTLGLHPANYAYVKTWEAKDKEIAKQILASRETQNAENAARAESQAAMIEKINDDAGKSETEKMGDKEIQLMQVQLLIDLSQQMADAEFSAALQREADLARNNLNNTPPNPPQLSESWNYEYFRLLEE